MTTKILYELQYLCLYLINIKKNRAFNVKQSIYYKYY